MFLSDTHLPQLLRPEHYTSQEHHEKEIERLFLPGWQYVCTLDDIPKVGDFFTDTLFDYPIIVWRTSADEVQTFLNVCPHRFARISHEKCGHFEGNMQCQYHGWQFDGEGQTRKIPDAQSFKPLTKGALSLSKIRTELCGKCVFVNFTQDVPSLRESLGEDWEECEREWAPDMKVALVVDYEVPCNWKIKVENTLESYHVEFIHKATFNIRPDAEQCEHDLNPWGTRFRTLIAGASRMERFLDRLMHRLVGLEYDPVYSHFVHYPNILGGKSGMFTWVETVFPVAPDRNRITGKVFCHPGAKRNWRSRLVTRGMCRWARKFFWKVVEEDISVMPDLQAGQTAPLRPSKGVISIREERVHHFQEYVFQETCDDSFEDAAQSTSEEASPSPPVEEPAGIA